MKETKLYLIHILECIARVERFTTDGYEQFKASDLVQSAALRELQVMAQSTMQLPDELKQSHPQIAWAGIRGFRNILVHNYLDISVEAVWKVIEHDLPPLKRVVEDMLATLDE
ncbi:MAG: DUF86 domain-containing protein [Anaerolineae bacterium]